MKYTTSDWKRETEGLKDEFSKKGITIKFEENCQPRTDGNTIYLPDVPEDVPITHEQLYALRGLLDHEAGHIAHTDFVDLQVWCEAHKDKKVLKEKHLLWNILEDTREEREVIKEYSGSKKHFKELIKTLDTEPNEETPWMSKVSSVFSKVRNEEYGYEPTQEFKDLYLKNKEFVDSLKEDFEKCESTQDVIELVNKAYEEYGTNPEGNPSEEDYEEAKRKVKEAQEGQGIPQEAGEEGDPSHSDEAQKAARYAIGDIHDMKEKPKSPPEVMEAIQQEVKKETSEGYAPYTVDTSEDVIFKPMSHPDMAPFRCKYFDFKYHDTLSNLGKTLASAKNLFRRALLSRENRGWESGHEQGRLDPKRYAQAVSGLPNVRKVRDPVQDFDTALHILIDCSGSMSGSKIKTAFECMVVLLECLKGTPVKIAVSGHTTGEYLRSARDRRLFRTEQVLMPLFKDYDQSLVSSIKGLETIGEVCLYENVDACAVRYALDNLSKRKESKKVLIVISDGHPAHSSSISRGSVLRTHKKSINDNQIRYKKNYGIETIGIGICAGHIREYYPNGYTVRETREFSRSVLKVLAKELLEKGN